PVARRLLLSSRRFPFLTPTTACWLAARHCSGALWSTTPGKKQRLGSKTRIACPIPPRSAAGLAAWTPLNLQLPFCAKRSPGSRIGATRPPDRSRGGAVILADSGSTSPLAPASLRNFLWRPPFMPGKAARLLVPSVSGGQTPPWARTRKTQTATFVARLLSAAGLGRPAPRPRSVVRPIVSPATRHPP